MMCFCVQLRVRPEGLQQVLVHGAQGPRGGRGRRPRASLVSPRTAPPRRVRRDGADAARVAYRLCGEWRRRRRRLAQATAFPTPCGRPVRHERERAMRLEEAHAGEVRRRGRRRGVVDKPGPVEVDEASLGDHGLRDARRRSRHEVEEAARGTTIHGFFQLASSWMGAMRLRWMHVMMAAAASSGAARALGCRFRGIVGAGRGGALRTCAVPRGSLRPGGAACKLAYEPSC